MTTALSVFNARVDIKLEGVSEGEYPSDSRDEQIEAALERYSKDRPKESAVKDLSGDGGKYYEINATIFTGWVEGFSRIILLEYPAPTIASDDPPTPLEDEDWIDDYRDATKRYLYLPNHTPGSSETMRITYTLPYVFANEGSETTDTPEQDFDAICHLAAGLCCQALAVKYGQSIEPTIGVDVINYAQKSDFYARRAKELIALYEEHLGIEEGVAAAGVIAELDVETTYLFHGRKTR